ncbi:type 2 lanthipeptide synthetase LanM [Bacillus thuringiensis]|uniref:type 2 lanthipeptide synthetase LanM n=1 Tax=Bacillus thuringiensis TaxID=1428 RepID=UPI003D06BDA7
MFDIENILYSFERTQTVAYKYKYPIMEQNIQLLFKNNPDLLKHNLKHILSIKSISHYKKLYTQSSTSSEKKLNIFSQVQKKIAKQQVNQKKMTLDLGTIFLQKISLYFKERLCQSSRYQKLKHILQDEQLFLKDIVHQFQKQMNRISYRTLVFDFHFTKQNQLIGGKNKPENLMYYNKKTLIEEQFVFNFFQRYPCLLRCIANEIRKTQKIVLELLTRYNKDKIKIAKTIMQVNHIVKIKSIKLGLGDPHCDGRKTIEVQLKHGKIMYKPRDSKAENFYSTLIDNWNRIMKEPNYLIKVPNGMFRKGYSWIEYIPFKTCENITDIHNFYKRMGVQMAFLYALNAIDLHFENIIAHGSHPIFIDLECLFSTPNLDMIPANMLDAHNKIKNKITQSVYSIGLLPVSNEQTKDISGMGTGMSNKIVVQSPQITKQEQTEITVKNVAMNYTMFKPNQPRFKGKKILVRDYIDDILLGFKKAYIYIKKYQVPIIREIENQKLTVRYLVKSTNKYASALDLSYHPRFLHHAMDRELFLLKACTDLNYPQNHIALHRSEFRELLNGDIPYFLADIHAKNLITSNHEKIKNFFSYSPFYYVCEKIKKFSEHDLDFQMNIIRKAVMEKQIEPQSNQRQSIPIESHLQRFQQRDFCKIKAREIGDYLFSIATTGANLGTRNMSWIQFYSKTDNSSPLQAMNDTLYDGISGMAVMYLFLWHVTKEQKYLQISESIMEDLMRRFKFNQLHLPGQSIGAFSGITSILYASLHFYLYTQNQKYLTFSYEMIKNIPSILQKDHHYDIIGGTAGILLVVIKFYELTNDNNVLNIAKLCGDYLIKEATHISPNKVGWKGKSKKILTGFSHGNAGIVFALQRLYTYEKDNEIVNMIEKAMSFENHSKVNQFWNDLRETNTQIDSMTWCHGSPGIILSRLELQKSSHSILAHQAQQDITDALSNVLHHGFLKDNCLCHGKLGNLLILLQYARREQNQKLKTATQNIICEIIKEMRFDNTSFINVRGDIGLMTGLAGVVYALLSIYDDTLPNIMILE